ncbi:phosphate/phosphite/phosphonate ABC transporter substrate-binding protein [Periweissella cryptocerci]|uniref:Phosphate/phosphite/phosphonate ABC transporter substrate-binding protein n=1 Tax=Periweissella cryptocerci TaxID=2506420 RepID=A0A4P6YSS8_9LACO|nr:phosphate/phosphite/phosphonate ABC transporter substrate-binding protein [Periweissella cryptocerci]QBO35789.1 phosphate/phosphite/phosphonate ABC transporter substrate-binding protein [Periweissella cryptocerci]
MRNLKRGLMLFVGLAAVVLLAACGKSTSDTSKNGDLKSLTVQFVPSSNANTIEAKAKPLEKLLSKQLGIPVHVSVSTDYDTIVEAMGSKKVDMGFLPPAPYTIAHKKYGVNVILQSQRFGVKEPSGEPTDKLTDSYASEVLVRKNSGINSIEDLKGKKIAVQDVTSDAGYIFPMVELDQKGIKPSDYTTVTVKGHDQGVLSVENKDTDAAFVFNDARNIVKGDVPTIFDDTKILYMTKPIPNDTISVRAGINKKWQDKISDAMLKITKTKQGHDILSSVYSWEGVTPAKDSNFDIVRDYEAKADKLN